MKLGLTGGLLVMAFALQGCAPAGSKQQNCNQNAIAGAVIGGVVGNQFGGGTGRTIATAAGAVAGSSVAQNNAGC